MQNFGGGLGGLIIPLILGLLIQNDLSPMIIFAIIGPLAVCILFFLK